MNLILLIPSLLSAGFGTGMLISSFNDHRWSNDWMGRKKTAKEIRNTHILTLAVLIVSALITLFSAFKQQGSQLHLNKFVGLIPIYFRVDKVSTLFVTVVTIMWVLVCIYSFKYMHHEGNEKRFYGFYLIVYAVLVALCFSGNLITLYFFYELMTVTSMPLVLHSGTRESIMASLKYLFYSMAGAYSALFGIYILYRNCITLNFTPGGTIDINLASGNRPVILVGVFLILIGFGAKAGMLPLHGWLPSAHPVAPAPASAVLSAIIVKGGVLAVFRSIYYIVGTEFIRGTWVHVAWMGLSLMTVLMGSMLAYKEKIFKKRLAYSTVSQVSYIMFGLSCLTETAVQGAMLHVVFHAFIKTALFLTAGIFIFRTGNTMVDDYYAIGRKYPITLWAYTFASLALVGIPPFSGFISKWYLAQGALQSGTGLIEYIGPAILLVSALLTAGYLLPITIKGFLPGEECRLAKEREKVDSMTVILVIVALVTLMLGVVPNPLVNFVSGIAAGLI
ncbi:MAG: proton-conducting transporter membrane subunit [Clostridia bacterium]|nr:proton-conducting transporter membrane subunit [Clostridia bacterium]